MNSKFLKSTLILLFLVSANLLCAQTDLEQDSLLKVIPTLKDTSRLKAMERLISITTNEEQNREYVRTFIEESKKLGNQKAVGWGKIHQLRLYYSQFQTDSIFIFAKKSEAYFLAHELYDWYFKGKQIVTQRYVDQGMYSAGLKEASEAYEKAKELNQPPATIAITLASLANAYFNLGQYDLAINYFNESNQLLKDKEVSALRSENYMHTVTVYINKKDYPTANLYTDSLQLSLDIEKANGTEVGMYYYFCEIYRSISFAEMGETQLALEHIKKAKQQLDPQWGEIAPIYLNKAYIYYYQAIGDYKKALEHNEIILEFCTRNNLPLDSGILERTLNKASILTYLGQYKEACKYYEDYTILSDSLAKASLGLQLNELRTIYELDKAEMEVEQQKLSIRAQHNMITGLTCSSILLLIIGLLIYIHSRRLQAKNQLLYKQIQEKGRLEEEIEEKNTYINQNSTDGELIRNGRLFAALKELLKDETIYTQPDIDRKAIAEMLNTNEKYLFDSIKEHTELSFSEYINELRLNLAKKLLSGNNNYTIEDIAIRSGFGSRRTFHRQFREKYKLSPAEFRKAAKKS